MATRSSRRSNRLSQQPRLTYAGSSDSDSPSDSTPATLESSLPSSAHPTPPVPPEPSGVGAPVSANDGAQGITTHTRTSGSAISATSKSGSKKANTDTKGATSFFFFLFIRKKHRTYVQFCYNNCHKMFK